MTEPHDPMDRLLREYADRWRDSAAPPLSVDPDLLGARPGTRRTWWLVAASAAAVAVVIAGGTRLVGDEPGHEPPPPADTTKPGDTVVPWAPLPATHPQIPTTTTTPSPDPAGAAGAPGCRASDLRATGWLGGAAGTNYLTVRLGLVGARPCRLEGWPSLDLLDHGAPAGIPLERWAADSVHGGPILVSEGRPAQLRLSWGADWCATPVQNDSIHLVLPGGFVTLPGLGGSRCYGTPGSGHKEPVEVRTFEPVKTREVVTSTPYADVVVTGALDITTTTDADLDFVVTLTSPHDLVLDPCPDYQIVQSGDAGPEKESHALNCAAVPYTDVQGRPYLPAGTPVRFAMHATARDVGLGKLSWLLDTVDQRGVSGTLTVTAPAGPSASAHPAESAQQKAALREGVRTIQAFLDACRRDGIVVASREYIAGDQLASSAGVPRLSSGKVLNASISSWKSADDLTLEVSLDLHFRGDSGAWNQGDNDRFVTLTRTGGAYRLSFATSP